MILTVSVLEIEMNHQKLSLYHMYFRNPKLESFIRNVIFKDCFEDLGRTENELQGFSLYLRIYTLSVIKLYPLQFNYRMG